jgi:hypothetical protein
MNNKNSMLGNKNTVYSVQSVSITNTIKSTKTSTYASLCLFFYVAHLKHTRFKLLIYKWMEASFSTNNAQLVYS